MFNLVKETASATVPIHRFDEAGLRNYIERLNPRQKAQLDSLGFLKKPGKHAVLLDAMGGLDQVVTCGRVDEDPRVTLIEFADLAKLLPPAHVYALAEPESVDMEQVALGWGLASYRFDRYQKEKATPLAKLKVDANLDLKKVTDQLEAIFLARDLVNTPASDLGPQELALQAKAVAKKHGATISIIEGEALVAQNYPTIYAVGKGSDRAPLLIDLRWGNPDHPKLTLVGKGVVFDTGGLNLKSASGMLLMKKDMGGGAVTLALAQLIMSQALPVRLRLLIPAVENSPGHKAFRPSDVIRTRKGISVEIGNTDAEGRLVLCDALAEAVTEEPELIIDVATLTGAARVALGQDLPGFWTGSDAIADGLIAASRKSCDPIWRMPLWRPYVENLKSQVADLNNMSNTGMGGAITAALYLHEFVRPFQNWVHFDAYCWRTDAIPGTPKGGEASALRAIYCYLEDRFGK